ncbi:hypothetical protein JTB14_037120 [Gonioctena quinquepunctata]|nr:hypothetical protein JTB14_037120 [Gonioctena quinquepunctata]
MALSFMIRNASRAQVFPYILKNTLIPGPRKPYSQLLNRITKNVAAPARSARLDQAISKRCMSADHSKLWGIERVVSIALLGIVPATFFNTKYCS